MMFYHPNKIGHRKIAQLIIDKVGIPASAKEITPTSGDIDVVFVVDSTGSMKNDVDAVRKNMQSIMERTRQNSSSYRFALVDYKDHPDYHPDNYLARTDVDFTTDAAAIETGLNSLTFTGGNLLNSHASVYSGVMQGIGLQWRPGVKKIIIVLGDAPPRDPEPETGYTAASVAQAAYEVDPVSVYGINTGGFLDSTEFSSLVTTSGGTLANSAAPEDLTELITQAVESEMSKPFAWIQGGYVIKAGDSLTIDARASYATSGELTSYEWDFNGDGVYDQTTTTPTVEHTFTEEFSGVVGLRVTQTDGQTATATTPIMVTDDGDQTPRESDNCPDVYNWGQTDYDGDGIGDECDPEPGFPTEDAPGVSELTDDATPTPSAEPTDGASDQATDPATTAPTAPADPADGASPQAAATTPMPTASRAPTGIARTGSGGLRPLVLAILAVAGGALALRHRARRTG